MLRRLCGGTVRCGAGGWRFGASFAAIPSAAGATTPFPSSPWRSRPGGDSISSAESESLMQTGRFILAVVLMVAVIVVTNILFPPLPPEQPTEAEEVTVGEVA